MSIVPGPKITSIMVSAANGDTYGDGERRFFRGIQTLVQANVKDMTHTAPPLSPSNGDTYVVAGPVASGLWSGQVNALAYWAVDPQDGVATSGIWEFYTPSAGWRVYDVNTAAIWQFNGTNWVIGGSLKQSAVPSGGVVTLDPGNLSYNAPPGASSYRINVNAAVTSVVIGNGAYDGQDITLLWVQDVTGHAVSGFSANIHGATTPSAGANTVSSQRFTWDSTNSVWYALSAGVTGM